MELDNLKYIFLENSRKAAVSHSASEIASMLKRKSISQVASLKRNLHAELTIALIFCVLPVYILAVYKAQFISLLAWLFLFVAALFINKVVRLLQAIARYETASNAIRQHLQLLITILNQFRRLYILSSLLVIPLFAGIAALLIHLDNLQKDPLLYEAPSGNTTVMYIFFSVALATGMYFFTNWYVEKLYGHHIKKLKNNLQELQ